MNFDNDSNETQSTTQTVLSYVVAPIAVYGAYKIGSRAYWKLAERRMIKKHNKTTEK